jgi:very-short-patch-repair endonuclease/KaiC/GvpD/RAD55 family RecA-like ATPase
MPDHAEENVDISAQRLKASLLDARRELIDLTRRNRLLNTTLSGKRPHCLEIADADCDEVFVALTRSGRSLGFVPTAEFALIESQTQTPANGLIQRLQTKLTPEVLERRLLKFFREARTFEEEQGVNILFLAIGFLRWFEDERSEESSTAPLLLIPVTLERRQARDAFVLRGRDDDMMINVSLAEKLRLFGIALPDIKDDEEWLPSEYLNEVANTVAGQRRWTVDRASIGLGFFTFSKFLMWRDLDAEVWPDANGILKNDLVAKLLGEGSPDDPEPSLASDEERIDQHIDFASAVHVLDADSSQALTIEEARLGRNLVVQGPPGTGKSQTIANVIAVAVNEGKSVLFVAEKGAALEVVHGRLKSVGLAPLCLEIHSKKATKLSVVASLEQSLQAATTVHGESKTASELRSARNRLNEWSFALHKEIRQSGRTPYQVMGTVAKRRLQQTRVLDERLDVAADWDRSRLDEAERAVERASVAVQKLGIAPILHAWYGAAGRPLTPIDMARLDKILGDARERLHRLILIGHDAENLLRIDIELSFKSLGAIVDSIRLLARAPIRGRQALSCEFWQSKRRQISKLVEAGAAWSATTAELANSVTATAWSFDIPPVREAIASHGSSAFRIFSGPYRRALRDYRSICANRPPRQSPERLALLDKILLAQSARRIIDEEDDFGREVFGTLWASEDTSWGEAGNTLKWAADADRNETPCNLFGLANTTDEKSCQSTAISLETAISAFRQTLVSAFDIVRPNTADAFGGEMEDVPLTVVSDRLNRWIESLHDFNDWVSANEALETLRRWGMETIAESLKIGDITPAEVWPIVDLLVAEALWSVARSDDPTLDQIEGPLRTETVSTFRAVDRKRIEIARQEVLARYLERRPMGTAGEMGVIRAEIGKKKRHLPIRKLMERAGSAVQSLKPIFLMSPLSVAQFLPPGRFGFDLVVMDEASQIPPEEALGAIARAKKIVIVGDDKQLPPTNFFRMVSADDEDNDEEVLVPGRTRDFESILTLARARGVAERMLRWHYRSRHPSLIALSNQSCYGGGLLLPPSPIVKAGDLGLSLIKTPRGHYDRGGSGRNPVEADKIAEALEKHLRDRPNHSLGIACFSVAQRDAIEDALLARGALNAAEAFAPKGERLFIKSLEAVQGDERDVIFISIGYGPDAQGRMTAGFGPLSADGGERRLNVLISRARLQCVVFSSITSGDIPADAKPRGTRMLREFLHYAETGHIASGSPTGGGFDSQFEEAVAMAIRKGGYEVESQVGVSGFRIDLGVLDPRKRGRFVLGVECDGATYHSGRSARDRDRLRQEVLEGLGWKLHRIWSTDWFRNPNRELQRLTAAIEHAIANSESSEGTERPVTFVPDVRQKNDDWTTLPITPTRDDLAARYQECKLSVSRGRDLLDVSPHDLIPLVTDVVHREGPVHTEEVARRIREAFGLARTGNRILDRIHGALVHSAKRGAITRDGEFWSPPLGGPDKPRNRRDASISLRRADRIAPQEYRLACKTVLRDSVAASKSELITSVARLLGFDRTGADLDLAISHQIGSMIADGDVEEVGGQLRLPN